MAFLKQTFNKYAREDAKNGTTSKNELKQLLQDSVSGVSKKIMHIIVQEMCECFIVFFFSSHICVSL